ncbi:TIGR00266 family protein [Aquimarina brevivitae]|uniref:Uncharacterized protein (TIGR00266 family) n=1 Tax=Aquimarina brevivitae TaxID=323412 RepID=A0A4Q7PH59_9FLAO|nr:TIGR00266 family protein [Aquimarina brevivitae]RZS99725.1 uncharacterized protein (TIGR00266 family) [Aquimarina brevivitae]
MKTAVLAYPNSYLTINLQKGEQVITERGGLLYAEGSYTLETKIEAKSVNHWLAKIFGGKSLTYNAYTAVTDVELILAPATNAELFEIELKDTDTLLIEPNAHFARCGSINLQLAKQDLKTTLNDGVKLRATGTGTLFLTGYGRIIEKQLDTNTPIIVDEEALIAYDDSLSVKTVSKGIKEFVTSGEGFLFEISGQGRIWLQTREKTTSSGGGGFIDSIFSIFR